MKNYNLIQKTTCLGLASLTLLGSLNVFAAEAYSYGFKFDSSCDLSSTAKNAASDFALAGYNSYYNTSPTWSYVNGYNPNTNRKRIESEIFFFNNHAAPGKLLFKYLDKNTSEYYFHITSESQVSTSGYHKLALLDQDLDDVKLMVFAGCNTANAPSNAQSLPSAAYSAGAQACDSTIDFQEQVIAEKTSLLESMGYNIHDVDPIIYYDTNYNTLVLSLNISYETTIDDFTCNEKEVFLFDLENKNEINN